MEDNEKGAIDEPRPELPENPAENPDPEKFRLRESGPQLLIYLICAFIGAIAYNIAFTGWHIRPQLSLFVFCFVALVVLWVGLNKLGYLSNKKAFLWALPILVFASFNAIYQLSVFSYINAIVILVLFAILIFGAVGRVYGYGLLAFWVNIFRLCFGNIQAGLMIFASFFKMVKFTKNSTTSRFLLGLFISLPIMFVVMVLLLSADMVFLSMLQNMFSGAGSLWNPIWNIVVTISATIIFGGYLYQAKFMQESKVAYKAAEIDNIIAFAFLLPLNFVFLIFCYIQFAFLFVGGLNQLPAGITYAVYARSGFFQLLFVTIINFAVIVVFLARYSKISKIVRVMLLMLCIFTAILIASSLYRMNMYISVFGFTPLRLMVISFLIMEIVLLAATIPAIMRPYPFLKTYLVVGLLFLAVANITTTAHMAGRLNLQRHMMQGGRDFDLSSHFLGIDNATQLIELYPHVNATQQERIRDLLHWLYTNERIMHWQNFSAIRAANLERISRFLE